MKSEIKIICFTHLLCEQFLGMIRRNCVQNFLEFRHLEHVGEGPVAIFVGQKSLYKQVSMANKNMLFHLIITTMRDLVCTLYDLSYLIALM